MKQCDFTSVAIYETRPPEYRKQAIAVKLVPCDLPADTKPIWEKSNPLLVAAATDIDTYTDGTHYWSWCKIHPELRDLIGTEMMEIGCTPNSWYWCVVFEK